MSRQGVLSFLSRLRLAYAAFRNPQPIVEYRKGEWRCECPGNIVYDTSINPAFVAECGKCGAHRPYLKDGSADPDAAPKATNGNTRFHSPVEAILEEMSNGACIGTIPGFRRYDETTDEGHYSLHHCGHCHGAFVRDRT